MIDSLKGSDINLVYRNLVKALLERNTAKLYRRARLNRSCDQIGWGYTWLWKESVTMSKVYKTPRLGPPTNSYLRKRCSKLDQNVVFISLAVPNCDIACTVCTSNLVDIVEYQLYHFFDGDLGFEQRSIQPWSHLHAGHPHHLVKRLLMRICKPTRAEGFK